MNQRIRSAMPTFRCLHLTAAIALAMTCLPGAAQAQQDFNQGVAPAPAQNPTDYMNQQGAAANRTNGAYVPEAPGMDYPNTSNGYPDTYNQGQAATTPPSGYGQAPGNPMAPGAQGNPLMQLVQAEMQDYGIPAQTTLQTNLHGPTPTSIPGGQVITTDRLLGQIQQAQQSGLLIFHVLGQGDMIPGAQYATPAAQAGSFSDQTQQEFGKYLAQVTQGSKDRPMVFYCLNTQCWMSYNAALRAINMG
jgi:hypothetical protein